MDKAHNIVDRTSTAQRTWPPEEHNKQVCIPEYLSMEETLKKSIDSVCGFRVEKTILRQDLEK